MAATVIGINDPAKLSEAHKAVVERQTAELPMEVRAWVLALAREYFWTVAVGGSDVPVMKTVHPVRPGWSVAIFHAHRPWPRRVAGSMLDGRATGGHVRADGTLKPMADGAHRLGFGTVGRDSDPV